MACSGRGRPARIGAPGALGLAALAGAAAAAGLAAASGTARPLAPPPPGPVAATADVTVPALDGTPVRPLAPAADGAAAVLLFVMTDCPISNRYAPEVQRIHAAFADRAAFWLVYVDADRPPAALQAHQASFGYPFPAVRDVDGALARAAGATVTPEAAVYDGARRLVYRGRIDDRFVAFGVARAAPTVRDLRDRLARVVSGARVPFSATRAIGCYIPGSPGAAPSGAHRPGPVSPGAGARPAREEDPR